MYTVFCHLTVITIPLCLSKIILDIFQAQEFHVALTTYSVGEAIYLDTHRRRKLFRSTNAHFPCGSSLV